MALWFLLSFLLALVDTAIAADNAVPRNISSNDPVAKAQYLRGSPWMACNTMPRYEILLSPTHCNQVYTRITSNTHAYRTQGWHGINTPYTLSDEPDKCVMRLETNYRDESDHFTDSLMAHVGLNIAEACTLGGAASIGKKGFYVSVTGMVPAKVEGRGSLRYVGNATEEATTA